MNGNGSTTIINDYGLHLPFGFMNYNGKYLTAEKFGFKINASATTLRKKQRWIVESNAHSEVFIKSHLGRYLAGDKKGNVTCDSEDKDSSDFLKFTIDYGTDGRFTLRNKMTGYYFGGDCDMLKCYEKQPTESEWWSGQLDVHPQIHLRNLNRKTFAVLQEDNLTCTEQIPWGSNSVITLEYNQSKYALKSSDNRYLQCDGQLVDGPLPINNNKKTEWKLEISASSGVAFKDYNGKYLTAVGRGKMQSKNSTISKDELFSIFDSSAQGFFQPIGGKNVSIRQGLSLSANQDRTDAEELHQLEFHKPTGAWCIRAYNGKLWTVVQSGIEANSNTSNPDTMFNLEYKPDGSFGLKSCKDQKYVTAKGNGSLICGGGGDMQLFHFTMINRPTIILKCEFGYLAPKSSSNSKIECNKSTYDTSTLFEMNNGQCFFKSNFNNYWTLIDGKNLVADGKEPFAFHIEFTAQSKFIMRAGDSAYLKCEQNGTITTTTTTNSATEFEF